MAINTISPWQGNLIWKGERGSFTSRNGQSFDTIEFALSYPDAQNQEQAIAFRAIGTDKADLILGCPIGTALQVVWKPMSRKSEKNGVEKWWTSNQVVSVSLVASQPLPSQGTELPKPSYEAYKRASGSYQSVPQSYPQPIPPLPPMEGEPDENDMPF